MIICFDDYSMNRQWFGPHAINMNRTNRRQTKTDADTHRANEQMIKAKRRTDTQAYGRRHTETEENQFTLWKRK